MDIPEPPATRACSGCNKPLDWIWRAADRKWYAIVRYDDDPDPSVVKLHTCQLPGVERTWRKLQYQPEAVRTRGHLKTRAVLKAIAAKHKRIEE